MGWRRQIGSPVSVLHIGHDQAGLTIRKDGPEVGGGRGGVQGYVDLPCLQGAENRCHEHHALPQQKGEGLCSISPGCQDSMGEAVSEFVQAAVGKSHAPCLDRDTVGGKAHLLLEHFWYGLLEFGAREGLEVTAVERSLGIIGGVLSLHSVRKGTITESSTLSSPPGKRKR